jgi:hypothetical protein
MKIEAFAISYNEEIMMPYYLKHYSQFCERITIYDNYSTDRTYQICRAFPKVSVVKWDSGGEVRDDLYLKIKNNCWKHSIADWAIVGDIDELVYMFRLMQPHDFDSCTIIQPDWYEMVSNRLPSTPGQIYDEINEGVCLGQASKCIMFRPQALKEINYDPGAHVSHPVGDVRILNASMMGILHYKFLSPGYVSERHRLFGQRLSEINRKNRWGVQYEFSAEQTLASWQNWWDKRKRII